MKKMRDKGQTKFSFRFVTLEKTIKEVPLLSNEKYSQISDISIKIIKENQDLMAYFVLYNFNNAFSSSEYPATIIFIIF